MDNSLLTVADVLVNTVSNDPASPRCEAPKNIMPFTLNSTDNPHAANTIPASEATTDNTVDGNIPHDNKMKRFPSYVDIPSDQSPCGQSATGKPSNKPLQNISGTLAKKTASQKADKNKNKEKPKTDDLTTRTSLPENLLPFSKIQKSSIDTFLLEKGIAIGISNSSQQQNITKAVSKHIIQLAKDIQATRSKAVLSGISERLTAADKTLKSNKGVVPTKDLSSSNSKMGILAGQITDATSKSSASGLSADVRAALLKNISEKIASKQNPHGQSAAGGSSYVAGSANQKTQVLNLSSPLLQEKPLGSGQKTSITTEKSTFVAEKPMVPSVFTKEANTDASNAKTTIGFSKGTKKESSNNQAKNSSIQKPNLAEFQVIASQKNLDGSKSYNNSNSNLEGMFSSNNTHSFVPEHSLDFTKVINITNPQGQTSSSGVSGSISEQIIESMRASLNQIDMPRQVMVRLEPPDLGNILVRFQEQEDEITGLLEFSKPEIKHEIEQILPQIIRTLADCGVQIKRLDVQLSDQFEPNADRTLTEGNLENGLFQHQHSAEGNDFDENGEEWLTNSLKNSYHSYHNDLESQLVVTDESINMLI